MSRYEFYHALLDTGINSTDVEIQQILNARSKSTPTTISDSNHRISSILALALSEKKKTIDYQVSVFDVDGDRVGVDNTSMHNNPYSAHLGKIYIKVAENTNSEEGGNYIQLQNVFGGSADIITVKSNYVYELNREKVFGPIEEELYDSNALGNIFIHSGLDIYHRRREFEKYVDGLVEYLEGGIDTDDLK